MKISVALAVYNEEKILAKCLESVSGWAYEIVVVDGSSADKTADIARSFGAKVTVTTNKPNLHINKQLAIDSCKGDWILQLDADEVVTEELKEEIERRVKGKGSGVKGDDKEINGYFIPRRNYFLGRFLKKGGQYPDYTLRLYKRGKGRLPCKDVHEQAMVEGETGVLENPLLHYSYPDFSHYLEHFNLYTSFSAKGLEQTGEKPGFVNYFFLKPMHWFFSTYIRHKGFMDGFAGFVFSLFSSLRFPVIFIKYRENKNGSAT